MEPFEEFKKEFEEEAYEDYRTELKKVTGMEPAIPSLGAPLTWKYNLLLKRSHLAAERSERE